MLLQYVVTVTSVVLCMTVHTQAEQDADEDGPEFTHEWAVRVLGGERHARDVATDTGFTFVKPVRQYNFVILTQATLYI